MLPQADVWQELRQRALDTVPVACGLSYSLPTALAGWLHSGSYWVSAATSRSLTLEASSADIGSALLAEAHYSADHALEHSLTLRNQLACHRWSSPAWIAVTFYYWGFHLAVGLTRILGKTAWYLPPDLAKHLVPSGIAAGPCHLNCGPLLSATNREVTIKRSGQTRVHDAVWRRWFSELRACADSTIKQKRGGAEARLYLALIRAANALGDSWPSDLRNELNYTAAFGYGAVRKDAKSDVFSSVLFDPSSTVSALIERLEGNVSGLVHGYPVSHQIPLVTKVLIDSVFAMDMLLRMLLDEVSERRKIDKRWLFARSAFAKLHAREFEIAAWPCLS